MAEAEVVPAPKAGKKKPNRLLVEEATNDGALQLVVYLVRRITLLLPCR